MTWVAIANVVFALVTLVSVAMLALMVVGLVMERRALADDDDAERSFEP